MYVYINTKWKIPEGQGRFYISISPPASQPVLFLLYSGEEPQDPPFKFNQVNNWTNPIFSSGHLDDFNSLSLKLTLSLFMSLN